ARGRGDAVHAEGDARQRLDVQDPAGGRLSRGDTEASAEARPCVRGTQRRVGVLVREASGDRRGADGVAGHRLQVPLYSREGALGSGDLGPCQWTAEGGDLSPGRDADRFAHGPQDGSRATTADVSRRRGVVRADSRCGGAREAVRYVRVDLYYV